MTPARIERATYSLEGCCSIQLSYGVKENCGFSIVDLRLQNSCHSFHRVRCHFGYSSGYSPKGSSGQNHSHSQESFVGDFGKYTKGMVRRQRWSISLTQLQENCVRSVGGCHDNRGRDTRMTTEVTIVPYSKSPVKVQLDALPFASIFATIVSVESNADKPVTSRV